MGNGGVDPQDYGKMDFLYPSAAELQFLALNGFSLRLCASAAKFQFISSKANFSAPLRLRVETSFYLLERISLRLCASASLRPKIGNSIDIHLPFQFHAEFLFHAFQYPGG